MKPISMGPIAAYVVPQLSRGGTELSVERLIDGGLFQNFDLRIIAMVRGDDKIPPRFEQLLPPGAVSFALDKPGVSSLVLPKLYWALKKKFNQIDPNIIILSGEAAHIAGRLAALHHSNVPIVTFEHEALNVFSLNGIAAFATSFRSDMTFGDTQETIRASRSKHVRSSEPAREVPPIILTPARARVSRSPTVFHLLSIGSLTPQKNYSALINAFSELRHETYPITLDIYGEGKQRDELSAHITRLGLSHAVQLHGFVADPAVLATARSSADIYIQPSIYEDFCPAVAEALADGIPTIASDVGGMRDYGIDGVNMLKTMGPKPWAIAAPLRCLIDNYAILGPRLLSGAVETVAQYLSGDSVRSKWSSPRSELHRLASTPRRSIGTPYQVAVPHLDS
jgi:glycosyltransferase involved in cell wall biosynthesis